MDPLHLCLSIALAVALLGLLQARAQLARARAERDLAAARLQDMEAMRTGFQSVAGEVLRNSNEEFLRLAKETLAAGEARSAAGMEQRRAAIDQLIEPLKQAVQDTHAQLRRNEKEQAGLREHILSVSKSNAELRSETSRLVQALRKPNVRGRYGEIQLERVVELAGLRSYCDFTTQAALYDDEGNLQKPDMVVQLPNGRCVAVDAKTPLDAYMDALACDDEAEREKCMQKFAKNFFAQVKNLAAKEYWSNFEHSPELVVMFVPGDQLVDAALERHPDLLELAARSNVVIASPSTLIGLLRAIHVGWREQNLTESAEELFRLGRELHGRAATVIEHVARVGESIDGARKHYNTLVGSVQSRLIPTLRRFEERDARSTKDVIDPDSILGEIRPVAREEHQALPEAAGEEAESAVE